MMRHHALSVAASSIPVLLGQQPGACGRLGRHGQFKRVIRFWGPGATGEFASKYATRASISISPPSELLCHRSKQVVDQRRSRRQDRPGNGDPDELGMQAQLVGEPTPRRPVRLDLTVTMPGPPVDQIAEPRDRAVNEDRTDRFPERRRELVGRVPSRLSVTVLDALNRRIRQPRQRHELTNRGARRRLVTEICSPSNLTT